MLILFAVFNSNLELRLGGSKSSPRELKRQVDPRCHEKKKKKVNKSQGRLRITPVADLSLDPGVVAGGCPAPAERREAERRIGPAGGGVLTPLLPRSPPLSRGKS